MLLFWFGEQEGQFFGGICRGSSQGKESAKKLTLCKTTTKPLLYNNDKSGADNFLW
jgi:hypothetical protein